MFSAKSLQPPLAALTLHLLLGLGRAACVATGKVELASRRVGLAAAELHANLLYLTCRLAEPLAEKASRSE